MSHTDDLPLVGRWSDNATATTGRRSPAGPGARRSQYLYPSALVNRRKPFYFEAKIEKSGGAAQLGVLLLRKDDDIAGAADREPDIAKLRKVRIKGMEASRAFRLRVDEACSGRRNHFASPIVASLSCSGNTNSAVSDQARDSVHSVTAKLKCPL